MRRPRYDYTTAQGQKRMQRSADRRVLDLCRTFNDVMTGPNPLTKEEIRALIEKRPDVYSILAAWSR